MESVRYEGFKGLECYKEARLLRMYVLGLVKKFPTYERYLLSAQITDSSRSSPSNIAESYGRYTYKDTRNFSLLNEDL